MTTPAKPSLDDLVSIIQTWQVRRKQEAAEFSLRGFRGFVELMNFETRKMIALLHVEDPDFWSAMQELATNAMTQTEKRAKLFADKKDVTNL